MGSVLIRVEGNHRGLCAKRLQLLVFFGPESKSLSLELCICRLELCGWVSLSRIAEVDAKKFHGGRIFSVWLIAQCSWKLINIKSKVTMLSMRRVSQTPFQ